MEDTLIKRIMETLVIPNIDDPFRKERAKDELPQSGSGKTIMTSEPKFIPEEAIEITPDGTSSLSIRMIDSVGYMVDSAIGAVEDDPSDDEYEWKFRLDFNNYYTDQENVYLETYGENTHLNGRQTLAYARIRKLTGGDAMRTERQRLYQAGDVKIEHQHLRNQ